MGSQHLQEWCFLMLSELVVSQPDPLPSHVVAEPNGKTWVRVLVSLRCWGLLSCPPGPHRLPPVPSAPGPGDTGCPSPLTHTHTHTHFLKADSSS